MDTLYFVKSLEFLTYPKTEYHSNALQRELGEKNCRHISGAGSFQLARKAEHWDHMRLMFVASNSSSRYTIECLAGFVQFTARRTTIETFKRNAFDIASSANKDAADVNTDVHRTIRETKTKRSGASWHLSAKRTSIQETNTHFRFQLALFHFLQKQGFIRSETWGPREPYPPKSSTSCHFVLWEAMFRTKHCCSLKVKV